MASVTKKEIPHMSAFMSDLWELEKKYWIPKNTKSYWDALTEDCSQLVKKYKKYKGKDQEFITSVLTAFYNRCEKEERRKHGSNL